MKLRSQSSYHKRKKATITNLGQVTSELPSLTLWSLTIKDSVKVIKTFARSMGLKYISKEVISSKTFSWPQKTKIHSSKKLGHI